MRALGDRVQALGGWFVDLLALHHLIARLLESDEMAGEVTAVDCRYVGGLQHTQLVEVVPVEEMTVEPTHALQRTEYPLEPIDHLRACDKPEIGGANRRQQLQSDVRRRGATRYDWLWIFLEVVGREPMCVFSDELL